MSRLLPDLDPDAGISRDEVALLFGHHDTEDGMRLFLAEERAGVIVRQMHHPETGEWIYHLGDTEAMIEQRRVHGPKASRKGNGDGVTAPEVRAGGEIIFSDDDSPDAILLSDDNAGGKGKGTMAIPVAKAAEQAGLSEEDLSARLVGRARLKVVDGVMVVPLADLRELAEGGSIPKPAKQTTTKPTTDPLAAPSDAAAERRTASMGAALGIEDTAAPTPAEPVAQAGIETFSADRRPPRRLGQPRRWSEN